MKKILAILILSFASVAMLGGCASSGKFISEEILPAMTQEQRADAREGAQEFIDIYDESYNLDGTPKVEEPEEEPEPAPAE